MKKTAFKSCTNSTRGCCKSVLLSVLFLMAVASYGQSISGNTLTWSATSAVDNSTGNPVTYSCSFVTDSTTVQWIQAACQATLNGFAGTFIFSRVNGFATVHMVVVLPGQPNFDYLFNIDSIALRQ